MRRMMLSQIVLLAACVGGPLYRNAEYGFSAALPEGREACHPSGRYEHDRGLGVFLDDGPLDCGYQQEIRPYMGVVGEYNAADYATAEEAMAPLCQDGTAAPPPPHLAFPGVRSIACRRDTDDGRVSIRVLAQHWSWPPGESETAYINYVAWLDTTADRLESDTAEFRALLDTVQIFKPGQ